MRDDAWQYGMYGCMLSAGLPGCYQQRCCVVAVAEKIVENCVTFPVS